MQEARRLSGLKGINEILCGDVFIYALIPGNMFNQGYKDILLPDRPASMQLIFLSSGEKEIKGEHTGLSI